jgi:hypothetical protein
MLPMPDAELSPEAARRLRALTAAVEELAARGQSGFTIKCAETRRLASARIFAQSLDDRMMAGEAVSASEVRAADDMVKAALAVAPRRLELRFVGFSGTCPCCGFVKEEKTDLSLEELQARRRRDEQAKATIDATASEVASVPALPAPDTVRATPVGSDQTKRSSSPKPPKPLTAAERSKTFHAGGPVKQGGAGEPDSYMGGFSGPSAPFRYDRPLPELKKG